MYLNHDGKHCDSWVKKLLVINPIYTSGIGVGPFFKGVKDFATAAIEFDFKFYSLSYDSVLLPSSCVLKGCYKCA